MGRAIAVAFARAGADVVATDVVAAGTRNENEEGLEEIRIGWKGLESLAAEIEGLGGRILTVTGDATNDDVAVWYSGSAQNLVHVQDFTTGKTASYNASLVNRVAMYGGDGLDCLNNNTMIPTTFNGGNGTDTLDGGFGNDVFLGSPGMDMVIGMQGHDVFHRNGYDG